MIRSLLTLGVAAALAAGPAAPATAGESCGFGTTIDFVDTPKEAAAQAKKDEKLVLVLHVSGNFENPGMT